MDEKNILKAAYTLFVAVLIALFVGFGVSVFYPGPTMPEYPSDSYSYDKEPSPEQKQKQDDYQKQYESYDKEVKSYNQKASTITLSISVLLLAISLIFEKRIHLIANGVLFGGLFTLIYSLGLGLMVDDRKYSFVVVSASLFIALTLGYLKFLRPENKATKKK